MSGKGSSPRPFSVSQDEFAERFDAIFGRTKVSGFPETTENVEPMAESYQFADDPGCLN